MIKVYVKDGDVTKAAKVDALVTLINSGGMWFGGVDGAIKRLARGHYHTQAAAVQLSDGNVVLAKKGTYQHSGSFTDVIFVVDDLRKPLGNLVYSALNAAKDAGYKTLALPLMRTGVMLGAVEPDVRAVVEQMKLGMDKFIALNNGDLEITIVVYNDPQSSALLRNLLADLM